MRRTVIVISIVFILFLSFSAVQAEDNLTDVGEKTFDGIQQAIDSSQESGVVELEGSYYGNASAVEVDKAVTIRGAGSGARLNAQDKSQILKISADNVVLENLVFSRGVANYNTGGEYGGAIYATGSNLKIVNCEFVNNNAQYGGAIASKGKNVSIINCRFSSNAAQSSGGAIELDGTDNRVDSCVFKNNAAGHVGAAVAWVGAKGSLSNSAFDNSGVALKDCAQFGGAVVWMGADGRLTGSAFTGFQSKTSGAAVYWKGANGTLSYCIFEKNKSPNDMAYWGNPEYVEYDYWGENINSSDDFAESRMISSNGDFTSPKTWVNIRDDGDSVNFVSNDGSALKGYLPDYAYGNIVIANNSYGAKRDAEITADNVVTYCLYDGRYLDIALKSDDGPLASRDIQIRLDDEVFNRTTDADGEVKLKLNFAKAGTYGAAVSFGGDDRFNAASKTVNVTVKKQKPSITLKTKTLKLKSKNKIVRIVLKDQFKNPISKRTVKLTVNKKTYTAKTKSNGVAKFRVSLKAKKTYKYKVKFSEDNCYKGISKTGKVSVK